MYPNNANQERVYYFIVMLEREDLGGHYSLPWPFSFRINVLTLVELDWLNADEIKTRFMLALTLYDLAENFGSN